MSDEPASERDEQDPHGLALRWNSAAVHLIRRLRRTDVALGLPTAQASALSLLAAAGPHTVSDLAMFEQVATPTMTRIVTALEARGLVRRTRDSRDARLVRVSATPEGLALIEQGRQLRVEGLAAAFGALTPEQRRTLAEAAHILQHLPAPAGQDRDTSAES